MDKTNDNGTKKDREKENEMKKEKATFFLLVTVAQNDREEKDKTNCAYRSIYLSIIYHGKFPMI